MNGISADGMYWGATIQLKLSSQ